MGIINSILALLQLVFFTWLFKTAHDGVVSLTSKTKTRSTYDGDGNSDSFIDAAMFLSQNE
tara:strand:- start:46 stop:228 length:183 start_codon:yes stop_codon:yes gene_type:complete